MKDQWLLLPPNNTSLDISHSTEVLPAQYQSLTTKTRFIKSRVYNTPLYNNSHSETIDTGQTQVMTHQLSWQAVASYDISNFSMAQHSHSRLKTTSDNTVPPSHLSGVTVKSHRQSHGTRLDYDCTTHTSTNTLTIQSYHVMSNTTVKHYVLNKETHCRKHTLSTNTLT